MPLVASRTLYLLHAACCPCFFRLPRGPFREALLRTPVYISLLHVQVWLPLHFRLLLLQLPKREARDLQHSMTDTHVRLRDWFLLGRSLYTKRPSQAGHAIDPARGLVLCVHQPRLLIWPPL